MQRDNTYPLHPRNSNLALPQFVGHGWRMVNIKRGLRTKREAMKEKGVDLAQQVAAFSRYCKTDFKRELRAIRGKLQEAGWSMQDWASDADIAHSTLWRILDRAQTPSLPTYLALLKSADKMIGEKKIASAQK